MICRLFYRPHPQHPTGHGKLSSSAVPQSRPRRRGHLRYSPKRDRRYDALCGHIKKRAPRLIGALCLSLWRPGGPRLWRRLLFEPLSIANCDYHADQLNKTIVVRTSRLVRRGEELTIDYGWDGPDFVRITGRSAALEPESESHRCWLLAEFYREADRLKEAAQAYAMRAAMSADEEAWYARVQEARCLRMMGDEGGFVRQALAAVDHRPQRAEPLYDLARFCRERGMNAASVLFSEAGLGVPRPQEDALFVEDFVYTVGLKEEFALAAYYAPEPARRARGRKVCNWLALARTVPEGSRNRARSNLHLYAEPAGTIMPSLAACPVGFVAPEGYRLTNPSVALHGGRIVLLQPAVEYRHPARTRQFLLQLSEDMAVQSVAEV